MVKRRSDAVKPLGDDHACPMCQGTGRVSTQQLTHLFENQPGRVGKGYPDTSKRAANSPGNVPGFGTGRYYCLESLVLHGPGNDYEVAQRIGRMEPRVASRMGELRGNGYVEFVRDINGQIVEHPTPTSDGRVQQANDLGRYIYEFIRDHRKKS